MKSRVIPTVRRYPSVFRKSMNCTCLVVVCFLRQFSSQTLSILCKEDLCNVTFTKENYVDHLALGRHSSDTPPRLCVVQSALSLWDNGTRPRILGQGQCNQSCPTVSLVTVSRGTILAHQKTLSQWANIGQRVWEALGQLPWLGLIINNTFLAARILCWRQYQHVVN